MAELTLSHEDVQELLVVLNVALYDANEMIRRSHDITEIDAYKERREAIRRWIHRLTQQSGSAEFDHNTHLFTEGDLYVQEIKTGIFTIHQYDGESWEQLGAGHSEQDIQMLTASMQFLGESPDKRQYWHPTGE
jgi:hypothetical protein